MSKRVFGAVNLTFTGTADTSAMANATYMSIEGGSATLAQYEIEEIYMAGTASTSNVAMMMFAKSSTLTSTPATIVAPVSDGPLDPAACALTNGPVVATAATTGPSRSVSISLPRLNLAFNAFGGIVRWVAAPYERYILYGTAVNVGAATLSNYTGGGTNPTATAHIVYEVI